MPNIANVLKAEISRIAKKEARAQTQALKKASAAYRAEIAALKRRTADLEGRVRQLTKELGKSTPPPAAPAAQAVKFTAKGLASQRRRLKLSADALGLLVGVSGQSVYNWERGTTVPYAKHLPAVAALKTLSARQAAALVDARKHPKGGGISVSGG